MKIGGKKPGITSTGNVGRPGDFSGVKKQEPQDKPSAGQGDNVNISSRAKELNKLKGMADSTPDVRSDMVVRLKTQIENGDYSVDAGKVAEKMIERALRDIISSGN